MTRHGLTVLILRRVKSSFKHVVDMGLDRACADDQTRGVVLDNPPAISSNTGFSLLRSFGRSKGGAG